MKLTLGLKNTWSFACSVALVSFLSYFGFLRQGLTLA